MTPEDVDRVAAWFATFHTEFAPLLGRTEARQRSEQYLRQAVAHKTADHEPGQA